MIESKIEKGEEAEFEENEEEIDLEEEVMVKVCLKKKNIEWVKQHYGSLSAFVEKLYQDYVRAINELK